MNEKNKIYEVGYIIVPTVSPDHINIETDKIHELITKGNCNIISEELPKIIRLAYKMTKDVGNQRSNYDTGHFGWVKFEDNEDQITEIKKALDLNEKILRFIIVKTVAENTLYGYRIAIEKSKTDRLEEKKSEKPEKKAEIDQEELDKSIDKLVIE